MGKEIKPAQSKLSEAIAARRINLWGRQPGSLQIKQIPNDLFSPSKYKVIVTLGGHLSTEPPHKRHKFEQEYKDDMRVARHHICRGRKPTGVAAGRACRVSSRA